MTKCPRGCTPDPGLLGRSDLGATIPIGDCYRWAGQYSTQHPGSTVYHGTVVSPFSRSTARYGHAWVVDANGIAHDWQMTMAGNPGLKLADFKKLFKPRVEATYPGATVIGLSFKTGHWGPFHGLGRLGGTPERHVIDVPPGLMGEWHAMEAETLDQDSIDRQDGKWHFVQAMEAAQKTSRGYRMVLEGPALEYARKNVGAVDNTLDILRSNGEFKMQGTIRALERIARQIGRRP